MGRKRPIKNPDTIAEVIRRDVTPHDAYPPLEEETFEKEGEVEEIVEGSEPVMVFSREAN